MTTFKKQTFLDNNHFEQLMFYLWLSTVGVILLCSPNGVDLNALFNQYKECLFMQKRCGTTQLKLARLLHKTFRSTFSQFKHYRVMYNLHVDYNDNCLYPWHYNVVEVAL